MSLKRGSANSAADLEACRRAVLRLFVHRGFFDEDQAKGMLQWSHSGFHVHAGVGVSEDDRPLALRLARYCARNPVASDGRRLTADGLSVEEPVAITDPVNWSLRAARYRWAELLRRIYDDSGFTRIPDYQCRRANCEPVDRLDCRGAGISGADVTPGGAWLAGSRPDGRNVLAVRGLRRRGDARHGPGRRIVHP